MRTVRRVALGAVERMMASKRKQWGWHRRRSRNHAMQRLAREAQGSLGTDRHPARAGRSGDRTGRTNSAIAALNLADSSTNGSWPECSNQTSLFEGAVSASK